MTRLLALLFALVFCVSIASAIPTGDLEWGQPQVHLLHIGESVTRGDYIIEATDFFSNYVLITVYDKNWQPLAHNVTAVGEYVNFEDRLNISVLEVHVSTGNTSRLGVPIDQWVKIESRLAGTPQITVVMQLERYEFAAGEEIPLNVSVRNYGTGKLKDARLSLLTNLTPVGRDKTEHDLYEIGAGNASDENNLSKMIRVRFRAPATPHNTTYRITALVNGSDVFGTPYARKESIYLKVLGGMRVEAHKYVRERTYIGEKTYVTLSVVNNGTFSLKNLTLQDRTPPLLQPPSNYNLTWNFDLPAGARKTISYPLTATTPGSYRLPAAVITWRYENATYAIRSNRPRAVITGPEVQVVKTADTLMPLPNSTVNITLEVTNKGDQPAIVRIRDALPPGASLLSGSLYRSMVVYQGETKKHTYTIQLNKKGTISLPGALISTTDLLQLYEDPGQLPYSRHNIRSRSNSLNLSVTLPEPAEKSFREQIGKTLVTPTPRPFIVEAEKTPVSTPGAERQTPGAGVLLVSTALLLAAEGIKRRERKNRKIK